MGPQVKRYPMTRKRCVKSMSRKLSPRRRRPLCVLCVLCTLCGEILLIVCCIVAAEVNRFSCEESKNYCGVKERFEVLRTTTVVGWRRRVPSLAFSIGVRRAGETKRHSSLRVPAHKSRAHEGTRDALLEMTVQVESEIREKMRE